METIGKRLKRIREARGLSLATVASRAQVPVSTYREWEHGRLIQGEPYSNLAFALNISINELITGKGHPRARDALRMIEHLKSQLQLLERELLSIV